LLTGTLACGLSWLCRRLRRNEAAPPTASGQPAAGWDVVAWDAVVAWGPSIALLLLTFGLSWPMERFLDWIVWISLWVADALWRTKYLAGEPPESAAAIRPIGASIVHGPTGAGAVAADAATALSGDEILLQRLTRFRNPQGQESLVGTLCAELAAGQRTTEVYVSFCPAFDRIPTIELEQSDGPPARIRVGHVLPHGARLDIRLIDPLSDGRPIHVDLFALG
jgi:hypothetical protein